MTALKQRIAILGAGTSGIAAARLAAAGGAAWVGVFDSGESQSLAQVGEELSREGIVCSFGENALKAPDGIDLVVLSPGIDLGWPIARAFASTGAPLIGEIEYAYRHCDCPVIAITGTNGKTTTTELTAAVLEAGGLRTVAAGNYGKAFSEVILSGQRYDVITLELSSFQLETIDSFRPQVAAWMNFAPDHLDRYDSLEAYRAAKLRVFEKQEEEDFAVINAADQIEGLRAETVTFSAFGEPADYSYTDGWIVRQDQKLIDYSQAKLQGKHNAENVMASLAIAGRFGVMPESVKEAVADYAPPRHRCEPVGEWEGRRFINDSKATNLHALASSLRGQEAPVVLIVGGKNKGLDYAEIAELLPESVDAVVCLGEMAETIAKAWSGIVPCQVAGGMEEAVRLAAQVAKPGQNVLFSPGTSSFDMFSGYGARGDAFRDAVSQLST